MTYEIADAVVHAQLDNGETIVLNLDSGRYFGLNKTATDVWNLISDGTDTDAIVAQLGYDFDIGTDTAASCVGSLIDSLLNEQLIRPATAAAMS